MTFHGVFPRANSGQLGPVEGSFLALGFDGRFLYSVATEGAAAWEPSEDVVHICAPIWPICIYNYVLLCIICAPKLIAPDSSYGRTASNSCFFHVWAFRYTARISRQKRWRSIFHKFLHGWRGTRIDLEITFDILWCKSSLCLRNMWLIHPDPLILAG